MGLNWLPPVPYRWLLLDFKREFDLEDSLRIFEVLGTHYLELTSDKALLETDKAIAKEFELDGGWSVGTRQCGSWTVCAMLV